MRPAELGLLASLGIGEVAVFRPLRVAFFSTGDELKSVGTALGEGEIYDSNRYTLHGMLARLGCDVLDMGVVRDDPALLEAAFREAAANADVVITSGGVSVGEADFVKGLLGKLGEVVFWKIAMKPGRPLAYGRIGRARTSSACPATPCRSWSPSTSSCARRCCGSWAPIPWRPSPPSRPPARRG